MSSSKKLPIFLKWAGGKRRIISELDSHFPKNFENYFEPFLGAGSVFFHIKKNYNPSYCEISDINKDLIETYKAVRDKPELLLSHLSYFKEQDSEKFYYHIRDLFNKHKLRRIRRCAAFIYLNKTCFNGIYRVNSRNEFNVPYGKRKNPEIFSTNTIREASRLLQGIRILHQDYSEIQSRLKGELDFVYLDPCYDPIKKTSFTAYTPARFKKEDRYRLKEFISIAKYKGVSVILSNNKLSEVLKLYPLEEGYKRIDVFVSRPLNSNSNDRGKVPESLIMCNC